MKYFLLFVFSLFFLLSCTEENITNYSYKRTLVVIADYEQESDLILALKGEIRTNFKDVEFVYLKSKKFDIYEGGFLLQTAFNYFPNDAYFCVIVDPGNGDKKFYSEYQGRKLFAPNNGILTLLTNNQNINDAFFLDNMDNFKGYTNIEEVPYINLYRQAIRKMLNGESPSTFGSNLVDLKALDIQEAKNINGVVDGQVLFVDNFGNCVTNITKTQMSGFSVGDFVEISSGSNKLYAKLGNSFDAVPNNLNVMLYDDNSRLNLAVNYNNFSTRYGVAAGAKISIKKKKFNIGILRYNSSDLVNNIIGGIQSDLKDNGLFEEGNVNYFVADADSDISKFETLISGLVKDGVDLIVPISTPAAKAAVQYVPENIPIVYTYVTSPEFAGLIGKRKLITGISDATNFNDYLKFVKELFPNITKAGRIYNNSEPNSEFAQSELLKLASFYNINFENETVSSTNLISQSFNNLKSKEIPAILVAADNTLNLGMKDLAKLCLDNSIPLIGDSEENAEDGTLAAISVNYDELAKVSGETIFSVILGINPDDIEIVRLPTSLVSINKITASIIGYNFPQSVLDKAKHIVEWRISLLN